MHRNIITKCKWIFKLTIALYYTFTFGGSESKFYPVGEFVGENLDSWPQVKSRPWTHQTALRAQAYSNKVAESDGDYVPAYTTKPTACSVFLTVQPRSSRLSIPAPTFSSSGFSLQQKKVRNPFVLSNLVRYSLLLPYTSLAILLLYTHIPGKHGQTICETCGASGNRL